MEMLSLVVRYHSIFMLRVQHVLLRHCVDVQSHICCWEDEAQGQKQSGASLPTNTDDTQTSWPLGWELHCSSINEDLLLY